MKQIQDQKLIIKNESDLDINTILVMVGKVIKQGKISGTGKNQQYCYVTSFEIGDEIYTVSAFLNEKSHRFVIMKLTHKTVY